LGQDVDCQSSLVTPLGHQFLQTVNVWPVLLPDKERTFLQQYSLQKRVLISQHEALIRRASMCSLQVVKVGFMDSNRLLQLLDIFRPALSKSRLCLTVSLFAFL
jgi:hypothetical protein